MHRRRFGQIIGSALIAPVWGCRRIDSDRQATAQYLGLGPTELVWLDALTAEAQRELRGALERPGGEATDRAVDLAFSLVGNRSRTFAFVGYPAVRDRRSICDGLLAE